MAEKKRLAIYTLYDRDGIADRYVCYLLKELKKVTERIVVVSNGELQPESRNKLLEITQDVCERENTGFDTYGYKFGLEYVGWNVLREYYEVVLLNDTLFGPVYPFEEVFSEMEKREDLDFWGLTRHPKIDIDPFKSNPYGYLPEHIQSFFMVYRPQLLQSEALKEYWDALPPIRTIEDAVGKHETCFTKHFEDKGFKWGVYVGDCAEEKRTAYILMGNPVKAIEKYRCPVFKKRLFFETLYPHSNNAGEHAVKLLQYLRRHTDYDTDMIWENIIRVCHQSDVAGAFGLTFVAPKSHLIEKHKTNERIALLVYTEQGTDLEQTVRYLSLLPENADIFVAAETKSGVLKAQGLFSGLHNRVEFLSLQDNVSKMAVVLTQIGLLGRSYDYVCFLHSGDVEDESKNEELSLHYKALECTMATREYVENVMQLFRQHPYLGMLSPLQETHGTFYSRAGKEWSNVFDTVSELLAEMKVSVPISKDKSPVFSFSGAWWVRGTALKVLSNYMESEEVGATLDSVPVEKTIDTLSRFLPFVVQGAGYYSAYVSTDEFVGIELSSLLFYARDLNRLASAYKIASTEQGTIGQLHEMIEDLRHQVDVLAPQTSLKTQIRIRIKRWFPKWLYGCIVRVKRFFFGPHDIKYAYDEHAWEAEIR